MEQLKKEKIMFLSLCSAHDRDLLTGRIKMTLQDFERLTYLTMALDYVEYSLDLHKLYMDYTNMLSEQLERESQILGDYPDYYLDLDTTEKYQKWIDDFCNHIPTDKQKYYRNKLNGQIELR